MWLGVVGLELVCGFAASDEGKEFDAAFLEDGRDDFVAFSVDDVDDSAWEGVSECFQQGSIEELAVSRELGNDGVPHDDRGNESGERFIQRIVVGTHAEGRSER